tara:strand:+ start:65 stop:541 length:477 start_codon:yes stop_codon:yes gene_type:complete
MASKYHITKDGRRAKKGLYYYMNRAKKRGTSKPGKGTVTDKALEESAKTAKKTGGAWTRKEGKSPSGGLNEKGRASLRAQGQNIKAPVTEDKPSGKRKKRKNSFCKRMTGMKNKLTGSKKRNDPNSRINKALRKWGCRECGGFYQDGGFLEPPIENIF